MFDQFRDQLFVTETAEQQAEREAAEAAEARIKAAEVAREAARVAREEAEARVKAAAEAEELRVTVLYGQWLSKFVRDDSFDETAYDKTVAIAVREKEAVDAVRRAAEMEAAAERERVEKEAAEEVRLEVLYGQWITISGFVRADGSFDEVAYGKKVAMAVREKGVVDAARKVGAAAAVAEKERQEKARAAEEEKAARAAAAEAKKAEAAAAAAKKKAAAEEAAAARAAAAVAAKAKAEEEKAARAEAAALVRAEAEAGKAAKAAEAELRRPARQAQLLAEWREAGQARPLLPLSAPHMPRTHSLHILHSHAQCILGSVHAHCMHAAV